VSIVRIVGFTVADDAKSEWHGGRDKTMDRRTSLKEMKNERKDPMTTMCRKILRRLWMEMR
jgi:hypothetical protein